VFLREVDIELASVGERILHEKRSHLNLSPADLA
jgi:hypothetical protein